MGDERFVEGVFALRKRGEGTPMDILNWYRNLYYKEGKNTERGLMAMAINDLFMKMKRRN